MRLKGLATGLKGLPTTERRYFLVYGPRETGGSKAIYVSVQWTVGKVIDTFADCLGLQNLNNLANAKKLRIFNHNTGMIVSKQMDESLIKLYDDGTLVDGQTVVLEYSEEETIDTSHYKL